MKVTTRISGRHIAELIIKKDGMTLVEDFGLFDRLVDDTIIDDLVTCANDFSRFSGMEDVDFVLRIANAFLNDAEREGLIQLLQTPTPSIN